MTTTDHTPNSESPSKTTCVIAGGGPAGLVLGLLLARAGVQVTVLEKHADFLRDFRGDTVHPTTLRSEEHTSELQSRGHLVCRLLLEKKNMAHALRDPLYQDQVAERPAGN